MFVTFEGIDGCGKTTQIRLLQKALAEQGLDPLVTQQPGGTEMGLKIRQLLLDPENTPLCPETELLLYLGDRLQHLKQVIEPALSQGRLVLCDRYHDSTLAYQGGGRGLDLSWLKPLESQIREPNRTFFFQIDPQTSRKRISARTQAGGGAPCRLEEEDKAFFAQVNQSYVQLAQENPQRFVVIEGSLPIKTIQAQVLGSVLDLLGL